MFTTIDRFCYRLKEDDNIVETDLDDLPYGHSKCDIHRLAEHTRNNLYSKTDAHKAIKSVVGGKCGPVSIFTFDLDFSVSTVCI